VVIRSLPKVKLISDNRVSLGLLLYKHNILLVIGTKSTWQRATAVTCQPCEWVQFYLTDNHFFFINIMFLGAMVDDGAEDNQLIYQS